MRGFMLALGSARVLRNDSNPALAWPADWAGPETNFRAQSGRPLEDLERERFPSGIMFIVSLTNQLALFIEKLIAVQGHYLT